MVIKILYTIFLGLLVALFIGVGIQAFYPEPQAPEYPKTLEQTPTIKPVDGGMVVPDSTGLTDEQKKIQKDYDDAFTKYQKETLPRYNRNVSIASMIGAIVVLVVSIVFVHKIKMLADGLLLGGVLTLFYSIIRGFMTTDNKYRFIVTTIGLVIAFIIGYLKFAKAEE